MDEELVGTTYHFCSHCKHYFSSESVHIVNDEVQVVTTPVEMGPWAPLSTRRPNHATLVDQNE